MDRYFKTVNYSLTLGVAYDTSSLISSRFLYGQKTQLQVERMYYITESKTVSSEAQCVIEVLISKEIENFITKARTGFKRLKI